MSQVQLLPTEPLSPPVSLYNGRPATTSREVASFFGKRHDDVIKSIRNLQPNCPEKFTARNFAASEYTDETGRSLPMFILYRDGFMLLVMGYTGKRALAVKLAYIEAFNSLEARLAGDVKALPDPVTTVTPSTTASRKPLEKLVKVWASQSGIPHAPCWTMLNSAFNLQSITELPEEWIPDAIAWVEEKIDGLQKTLPPSSLPVCKRAVPAPAPLIDEAPILQLIADIQTAHEQVEAILDPLSTRAVRLATTLALEIQKRGSLSSSIGMPYPRGLGDFLFHSAFESTRNAMTSPARVLDEYSNPGYMLLGIARQLNGRG